MPQTFLGATEQPCVSLLGSEFSLSDLLEHQLLQLRVCDKAFKLRILHAQLFKLLGVIDAHTGLALPPLVIRGGADTEFTARQLHRHAFSQEFIKALQQPDNVFRLMILSTCHNNRAFPPTTGVLRLSNNPDPPQGVMPPTRNRCVRTILDWTLQLLLVTPSSQSAYFTST